MATSTPTPWEFIPTADHSMFKLQKVCNTEGTVVPIATIVFHRGKDIDTMNKDLIERACNNYASMITALKEALEYIYGNNENEQYYSPKAATLIEAILAKVDGK